MSEFNLAHVICLLQTMGDCDSSQQLDILSSDALQSHQVATHKQCHHARIYVRMLGVCKNVRDGRSGAEPDARRKAEYNPHLIGQLHRHCGVRRPENASTFQAFIQH